MQNDISIEELKKDTAQREEKLSIMKKNIELLQINMAKKKQLGKGDSISNKLQQIKPQLLIHQRIESEQTIKSPMNYQNGERQFVYNSTLFKNINNQSQPIMQNGSAVSNFSSVSNINNLLNNKQEKQQRVNYSSNVPDQSSNLLLNIDKVLEKVQKHQKMPVKTLEKIIENRGEKYNSSMLSNESFTVSKTDFQNKQQSARSKIEGYKQMVKNLDLISEEKHKKEPSYNKSSMKDHQIQNNSFDLIQNNYQKSWQVQSSDAHQSQQRVQRVHKKNIASILSYQSEYPMNQTYKLPPTPTRPAKPKVAQNAVERQKAKIKESVQQYKKMQIQHSHQIMDKSDIDFQLSDQQVNQDQNAKSLKKRQLLKQKKQLELQLKSIEQELKRLQKQL